MAIFCSTSWGESTKQKILQRVIQRCSKWWCSKGNGTPAISGKSRLVKYYNLARKMIQFLVLRSEESDLFLFLLYVESWYFKTDCLFLHIFTLYFGRWSNLLLADVFSKWGGEKTLTIILRCFFQCFLLCLFSWDTYVQYVGSYRFIPQINIGDSESEKNWIKSRWSIAEQKAQKP